MREGGRREGKREGEIGRGGEHTGLLYYCIQFIHCTVEPPITDPPKGRQPPYSGQSLWHGLKSLQL